MSKLEFQNDWGLNIKFCIVPESIPEAEIEIPPTFKLLKYKATYLPTGDVIVRRVLVRSRDDLGKLIARWNGSEHWQYTLT